MSTARAVPSHKTLICIDLWILWELRKDLIWEGWVVLRTRVTGHPQLSFKNDPWKASQPGKDSLQIDPLICLKVFPLLMERSYRQGPLCLGRSKMRRWEAKPLGMWAWDCDTGRRSYTLFLPNSSFSFYSSSYRSPSIWLRYGSGRLEQAWCQHVTIEFI